MPRQSMKVSYTVQILAGRYPAAGRTGGMIVSEGFCVSYVYPR